MEIHQSIYGLTRDQFDFQNELTDAFYYGLDYLAQENSEAAADTFQAFVASDDTAIRQAAANTIYTYARYSKYNAFPVWVALLQDENSLVRDFSTEAIEQAGGKARSIHLKRHYCGA